MIADTVQHDPLLARVEEEMPAHYFDCDRFQVYDHGLRNGRCDCTAERDIRELAARLREAQRLAEEFDHDVSSIDPLRAVLRGEWSA